MVMPTATPLLAAPSYSSKQAEFRKVQAQVDRVDAQLDVVVEQYNSSTLALNKIKKELQSSSSKLKSAEKDLATRQALINKRFASMYRQGRLSYVEVLINTKSLDQFLYYLELIDRQAKNDARITAKLREAKREIESQRSLLLEKEKKQRAIANEIKSKKDKIAAQLKERNKLLAKIKNELAQYRAAQSSQQAKLKKKISLRYKTGARVSVSRGGGRSGVVSLALAELGKPYTWGASGPSSFDCSGFTSYVYRKVGVSLPHSSRAQYGHGQHVSRDELQPGDLVFFARRGTISHVGIYVGSDSFVHAPRTGDVVKISDLSGHSGYVGAVRP